MVCECLHRNKSERSSALASFSPLHDCCCFLYKHLAHCYQFLASNYVDPRIKVYAVYNYTTDKRSSWKDIESFLQPRNRCYSGTCTRLFALVEVPSQRLSSSSAAQYNLNTVSVTHLTEYCTGLSIIFFPEIMVDV